MRSLEVNLEYVSGELVEDSKKWSEPALLHLSAVKDATCEGGSFCGWYDWPKLEGFNLLQEIKDWQREQLFAYDSVVVIGIGGSYAGTRAVQQALEHSHAAELAGMGQKGRYLPIYYCGHNLTQNQMIELLEILEFKQPLVNVISKSGTTTEPSIALRLISEFMRRKFGEDYTRRILVTTESSEEKPSFMEQLAKEFHFPRFEVPRNVGGRFSVLTAVGMVPLALAGYPVQEIMDGADALFHSLEDLTDAEGHPVVRLASLRRAAWDKGLRIDALACGDAKLAGLLEWFKQLFGESEGKEGKGLFPVGVFYPTDLHSLGQYFQEGAPTLLETFLYVKESGEGNVERLLRVPPPASPSDPLSYLTGKTVFEVNKAAMDAARQAHAERGLDCPAIYLRRLDGYHLGYLFAFFETVCAVSALLLGVNPFDQPGVESYKQKMRQMLS